ncbi:hypothetical protein [Mycobacterium sp. E796]|nr:hypothetical protein [Mycobacterium sp. E796]
MELGLFTLRDNKILDVKEFFDIMAVRKAFGAPASNANQSPIQREFG